jgi:hypothetical protein
MVGEAGEPPIVVGEAGEPPMVVGPAGTLAAAVGELTGNLEVYDATTDGARVTHGTVTMMVVVAVGIGMMAVQELVAVAVAVVVPLLYPVADGYGAAGIELMVEAAAELAGGGATELDAGPEGAAASWLFTQAAAESV